MFILSVVGLLALQSTLSSAGSFDVASGAIATASSFNTLDGCQTITTYYSCAPEQVININGQNGADTTQWVSAYGSCEPSHNESLSLDWSDKYKTQLVSEIRFRYGDLDAKSVTLVIFSLIPMNVPTPTAVTYKDDLNWMAYIFDEPVTASGITLTFSDLKSKSNQTNSCYVAVTEVQAWIGSPPDSPTQSGSSRKSRGISMGAVIGIIVALLVFSSVLIALIWFIRIRRSDFLRTRLAREADLRRKQLADPVDDSSNSDFSRFSDNRVTTTTAQKMSKGIHNPLERFMPIEEEYSGTSAYPLAPVISSSSSAYSRGVLESLSRKLVNPKFQDREDELRLTTAASQFSNV